MAKKGWRSANLSPDRRVFFSQGRGDVRSRALAARVTASFGSRGGASTADLNFPLLFPPTLISVTPNTGGPAGGTVVDLAGMNFQSGATVTFGGIAATSIVFVSSSHITATTPAHAGGSVNVTVTNPDTRSSTLVNGFAYGLTYVAVGRNVANTAGVAAISSDGITWSSTSIPVGDWRGVAWNGSVFCAVGQNLALNTGIVATSPDGITWTAGTIPNGGYRAVIWFPAAGLFIAQGGTFGTNTATSPDGVVWTDHNIATAGGAYKAQAANNTIVVAHGSNTANNVAFSNDGTTWGVTSDARDGNCAAWNGGIFAALGVTGSLATSLNGSAWTGQAATGAGDLRAVTAAGSLFCVVGFNSSARTSTDGINWTAQSVPGASARCSAILWDGLQFVTVGQNGPSTAGFAATSPDGATWTTRVIPSGFYKGIALAA
jgi:hypothetical protein